MRLALFPGYASRRSFVPVAPKVHRFSFRRATLGLGQLFRLFHSSLSFRTPEAWLPDLRDFHPRLRTPSPSARRGRDADCPAPPSQIPAGGIPAPGSSRWHVVFAHRKVCPLGPSFVRHGLPVWASPTRRPLLQCRGCALPLDTMSRSDSRRLRRHFLSLRRPSCLALAVSAAGTLRASSVPCVCFGARHALRPRQTFHALTVCGRLRVGFR